ncbi:hypothetical protein [Isoptericola aurantiacus]|uniref:hypothetical protein n=1 Tax=Isoptericola aurantiacus TaxID=3377839 RepID=UPI003839F774
MVIDWGALGQVVLAGLIVGAGVPALFALGLRLLAGTTAEPAGARGPAGARRPAADRASGREPKGPVVIDRPSPARLVGAILCFGTVVGAVAAGLVFLAAGGH